MASATPSSQALIPAKQLEQQIPREPIANAALLIDETLDRRPSILRTADGWEHAQQYVYPPSAMNASKFQKPIDQQKENGESAVQLQSSQLRTEFPGPIPEIYLQKRLSLPLPLLEQYSHLQCRSFMGLFPEIHRAWFTIDHRLFLWNYADGSDFYAYEDLDQIIVSVALVKPKPGVFVENVAYVLAVATLFEVTLLGVCFSGKGVSQLTLVPTRITVSTDAVPMLKMASSSNGRLFLAGRDGHLHELIYSNREDRSFLSSILYSLIPWPIMTTGLNPVVPQYYNTRNKRARKLNRTRSFMASLIPNSIKIFLTGDDPLIDLVIDDERKSLFTLSERGVISVIDISDPNAAPHVASTDVLRDIQYLSGSYSVLDYSGAGSTYSGIDPSGYNRAIVAIFSVSPRVSSLVHLVVVTSWGERVYYHTNDAIDPAPPKFLRPLVVRNSPPMLSRAQVTQVHTAFWSRGSLVLADARDRDADALITIFPEPLPANPLYHSEMPADSQGNTTYAPVEVLSEIPLALSSDLADGSDVIFSKAWAIAEVPPAVTYSSPSAGVDSLPVLEAPSEFIVLTSAAIHLYSRLRPVDNLHRLLSQPGTSENDLKAFFTYHGFPESCAMCVHLVVENSILFHQSIHNPSPSDTVSIAASIAFNAQGGAPVAHSNDPVPATVDGYRNEASRPHFDVGRPILGALNVTFSAAHEGILLYVTRLIAPLWTSYVTSSRNPFDFQKLAFAKESLLDVRERLLALLTFIEKNPPMQRVKQQDLQNKIDAASLKQKRDEEARRIELNSLNGLAALSNRAAEAIALLTILSEHQIHRLVAQLSPNLRLDISRLRFSDLVASDIGINVSSALIEALFASYADDSSVVDVLGDLLKDRCPSYFGTADIALHRGLTMIRRALKLHAEGEVQSKVLELIGDAVVTLKPVSDRIVDFPLLCRELRSVGATLAVIELAIYAGDEASARNDIEYADLAYSCVFESLEPLVMYPHDPQKSSENVVQKQRLTESAMRCALTLSKNAKYYQDLFQFLLSLGKSGVDELLGNKNSRIESFLDTTDLDLLWKYYAKHDRYLDAAAVLASIAADESNNKSLNDRMTYLASAIHNTKIASSSGDQRAAVFFRELSDKMEVAKVQIRICEELQRKYSGKSDISDSLAELNRRLLDLSTLYNHYARVWTLYESELDALRCAGYRDEALVRRLWWDIVQYELSRSRDETGSMNTFEKRILTLGRDFYPSQIAFPVNVVVDILEQIHFEGREMEHRHFSKPWVPNLMVSIGVSRGNIVDGYRSILENQELFQNGSCSWADEEAQLHIVSVVEIFVKEWVHRIKKNHASEAEMTQLQVSGVEVIRLLTLCKTKLRCMASPSAPESIRTMENLELDIKKMNQ